MSYARQMLDTYPRALDADAGMLAAAIDATTDCAQARVADTGAHLGEQLDSATGHRPPSPVWASWRTQRVRLAAASGVVAELLCHSLAAAAAEKFRFHAR